MKQKHILILILVFVLSIAAISNPSAAAHKEKIRTELSGYLQKTLNEELVGANEEWRKAGQSLGLLFGDAVIERIVNNVASTKSYLFFSTTSIIWEGKTKTISIGAFGFVFLTPQLSTALDDGILNRE